MPLLVQSLQEDSLLTLRCIYCFDVLAFLGSNFCFFSYELADVWGNAACTNKFVNVADSEM